ncbi:MAG: UDP-N-acetylglucosamine 2-epimerase [Candidatus Melainabacteria bacterium RIFOXYA12_FULL_32_12]|nr:MAG: UDP-N-acetylglucosamine 2-epimerase [Candidatus Melainabacteria bacterium RIFOXYA2_FULL_32_9]OGI26339.1 MAG: UDP-N-acetylglucosamine 2-epimerase [Candidatus Melainabacteria bacterium RIFOXYA12_FULL_32_12]
MEKIRVLTVFGTRPEAIKMAPVVMELNNNPDIFESIVCVTAQHREMLDQVLELFKIKPDFDLNIMKPNQNLWNLTADVLLQMKEVYEKSKPHVVLVHGDTTTTLAASLSAFYAKIPIGHVEAGLRTFNKYYPFPEEINRVVADAVSSFYFAPTSRSADVLVNSGVDKDKTYMTGNTVIDALLYTVNNHQVDLSGLNLNKSLKTILLTSHRRENFGKPLENICKAVQILVKNNPDIQVVYPVHLNPNVRNTVFSMLDNIDRVRLIEPLDYAPFANLIKESHIILTDSGGIQEEAPSLGKPVLVLRDETERPEAIEYGTVKLVGSDTDKIVNTVQGLLDSQEQYNKMSSAVNPYGDGLASKRIIDALKENKDFLLSQYS